MRYLLLITCLSLLGCEDVPSDELPQPEEANTYEELPEGTDLVHIWPGGECCWIAADRIVRTGDCAGITTNIVAGNTVQYCGEHVVGDVRIDSCSPCSSHIHLP